MKIPHRLQPLLEDGFIDDVTRQLMSGKEAMVFVVTCGDDVRCAKVYKEANKRSFRQSVDYTEGRKTKNSRQARAMQKGSKYGRESQEAAWQSAEVDALYRLAAAGVRVPTPYNFYEGVLLMELITGIDDNAAPRLNDVELSAETAREYHAFLISQVVKMLVAGIVHGDLSEFNILVGSDGPVVIDLPQAVDAAGNNHAKDMLVRDVTNLANYFGQFAPELLTTQYAKEIWALYERGDLSVDSVLTGQFAETKKAVDMQSVMREIKNAEFQEQKRLQRLVEAKITEPQKT
ncbi:MAG: serine protein kinase RIO [Bdellovibrio sp.]|nr:serine protein kinase RIO [Methylotenera sp.]